MQDKSASKTKVLEVNNLECKYGDKTILASIFFEVYQNEVFILLGPGGSGKSTILKYLKKKQSPDLSYSIDKFEIASEATCMSQDEVFLENTFDEIFSALGFELQAELEKHWRSKWLIQKLLSYRDTLKTDIQKSYFKLLQFSLFLSKSKDSKILLLDEPDVNLYDNLNFIIDKINDLKREKTIVIVTHNIEFTKKIADQILYISYGKMVENSPARAFFKSENPDVQYILKMGC